jgi:predicted component of type VI protein secretion system
MYGELIPLGGGDSIPLLKTELLVGRREACDIVLRYPNVSSQHCKMSVEDGYWYVEDLNSSNGTKVNGNRITRKRLDPGDAVTFAKQKYQISYSPQDLGAVGPPPSDEDDFMEIMKKSLLDRAGLNRRGPQTSGRYDVNDDRAGQTKEKRELDRD